MIRSMTGGHHESPNDTGCHGSSYDRRGRGPSNERVRSVTSHPAMGGVMIQEPSNDTGGYE